MLYTMSSEISQTRKKIVEAASRLLLESKGQGVRMADIAKASGVSRQAVYLHFLSRGELMIAAVRYLDEVYGLDKRLTEFRAATKGVELLETFADFWGNYIPKIYGVARALLAARQTDEAAAAAWDDRMNSVRNGCRQILETLKSEDKLRPEWNVQEAVEMMWTILSIENWERLTVESGWTVEEYVERMKRLLLTAFSRE